jgi:deoxyribodipyrimidine photo-lyase
MTFARTHSQITRAARDFPAAQGVSYLSVHLRFGTVSIRELVNALYPTARLKQATTALRPGFGTDLARFLFHDPRLLSARGVERAFKPEYDAHRMGTRANSPTPFFEAWCEAAPAIRWSMRRCAS